MGDEPKVQSTEQRRLAWEYGRHARLVAGDAEATNELVAYLLPVLLRAMRYSPAMLASDMVRDAAIDAILGYIHQPERFDTDRGVSLGSFLYPAAARNLSNLLRGERRRKAREAAYVNTSETALYWDDYNRIESDIERLTAYVIAIAPERDRAAVKCWLAGDGTTDVLSAELGLSHLAIADRKREVKRFKDRLMKRIERAFAHGGAGVE